MAGKGKGGASIWQRSRSAITGRFVKRSTAKRHPDTTVSESGKRKK